MQYRRGPATVTEESVAILATDASLSGRQHEDVESGARRPAYSDNTALPTGDREVLKITAIVYPYRGFSLALLKGSLFLIKLDWIYERVFYQILFHGG